MAGTEDEYPVGELGTQGADPALRDRVGLRAARRGLDHGDAGVGQHCVEGVGELSGAVADQHGERGGAFTHVYQEVAGGLRGPRAVRVRGDTERVRIPGLELDHEE